MSRSIRAAVEAGDLSAELGAEIAVQMRNQIIEMQRAHDFDLGRALAQQRQVLNEVIESAGRSRPAVTAAIPRFRWAARGLWVATLAISAYNIGTAENPWWQSGRESANSAGGLAGGFAGGATMGAAGGI